MNLTTFSVFDDMYDVIIDDGLHSIGANFNTLLFGLDHLKVGGWLIIEDIERIDNFNAIDFILQSTRKYVTHMIDSHGCYMYAVMKL